MSAEALPSMGWDPEYAAAQINRALTDSEGYRISPPCEQAPDLWFPLKGSGGNHDVKSACHRCPALEECGIYAIVAGEELGIWGGESGLGRGNEAVRRQRLLTWNPFA